MKFLQPKIKTTEIKTIKHLEIVLQHKLVELENLVVRIDDYYYEKIEVKYGKDGKPKLDEHGNPKTRVMYPSRSPLKGLQKLIHRRILNSIPLPPNVRGGVKGNDNVANAKYHQGNKFKFATDLKDFYPSISNNQVFAMFLQNGFSGKVASLLTKLTTYRNELPQGTPTSPSIANLVFVPVDKEIIQFCEPRKIKYTRYVDDLSFSAKHNFQQDTLELLEIIKHGCFRISYKKTFFTSGIAEFTGIMVKNNNIDAPDRIKERLKPKNALNPQSDKGLKQYYKRIKSTNK